MQQQESTHQESTHHVVPSQRSKSQRITARASASLWLPFSTRSHAASDGPHCFLRTPRRVRRRASAPFSHVQARLCVLLSALYVSCIALDLVLFTALLYKDFNHERTIIVNLVELARFSGIGLFSVGSIALIFTLIKRTTPDHFHPDTLRYYGFFYNGLEPSLALF